MVNHGNILRKLRLVYGFNSITKLAEVTGINGSTLARIEKGLQNLQ